MEFVIARGFALPLASAFSASPWALGFAPELPCEGEVTIAVSHPPMRRGEASIVFDGHAFDHDLFVHRAAGSADAAAVLAGRDLADLGGAFCLLAVTVPPAGPPAIRLATDALGMYPLYVHRGGGGDYLVSNSAHALAAVLAHNGRPPARSFLPCLSNLTFNGPVDGRFLYEDVERLPHGVGLSFEAGRLSLTEPAGFRYEEDEEAYRASLSAAAAQMRGGVEQLLAPRPFASVVMDLTGGADSRTVLGLMLSMGLRSRFGIRNIMDRPHPDAHVAALLADRYGLAVGDAVVPFPGVAAAAALDGFGLDAFLHGGARDGGAAFPSDVFLDDYVHLTGFYGGGLGGKTGAVMTLRGPVLRMSVPARVDHLLARRRRIGQLDFVTGEGIERMRQGIIGFYERLIDQGARPETLEAEAYLAGRCRTHFGLASVQANRRRIQPDLLGNPWMVRARRALPPRLAAHDKVVFDLLRGFGGPGLAFAPMAEKRWDRSLVADADRAAWDEMVAVGRDTPSLSARMERLMKARFLPPPPPSRREAPALRISRPEEIVYPADRTRRFSAALVRWALENGARERVGHLLDVEGVLARIGDENWRPRNVVQAAFFDKLLPGLLWMIGAEAPSQVHRRMSVMDLPSAIELRTAKDMLVAAAAGEVPDPVGAARVMLRTARTGELTLAGREGAPVVATMATMPDGTPILSIAADGAGAVPREAMLRIAGEAGDGAPAAGRRLTLTGRLASVDPTGETADTAGRRHGGRHGAAAGATALWLLDVTAARLAGPFGTLATIEAGDLLLDAAAAAALAPVEPWALQRLNGDFAQVMALVAMRICGGGAGSWRVTGVDAEGLDLVRADGEQARRLVFPEPVRDGPGLKAMLVRLGETARQIPPPTYPSSSAAAGG